MTTNDRSQSIATTENLIPLLREAFEAGDYDGVFDAIERYCAVATANRAQLRARLLLALNPFVANLVLTPKLKGGNFAKWEQAFESLMGAEGAPHRSWGDYLYANARLGVGDFRRALLLLEQSADRFIAEQ